MEYEGYEYPITFHIIEKLPSNITGLIGTIFFKKFGAQIDFETCKLSLRKPLFEENFIIPPRTEVITFVEADYTEPRVIFNQELQSKMFIAGAVVEPKNGKVPVRLMNIKNKAVRIENVKPQTKPLEDYDVKIEGACRYDSSRAQEVLSELNLAGINDEDRPTIEKLCMKYNDIFCLKNDKLTVTRIYQPSLTIKPDTHPVYTRPYKLPEAQKKEV